LRGPADDRPPRGHRRTRVRPWPNGTRGLRGDIVRPRPRGGVGHDRTPQPCPAV